MAEWTEWRPLNGLYDDDTSRKQGVYEIRFVDTKKKPIVVRRLAGVDERGLYYIGKASGTFRQEIGRFLPDQDSEGEVHEDIAETLRSRPGFQDYRLQYRVRVIEDKGMIGEAEAVYLGMYLEEFCELPPGNRNLPREALNQFLARFK